PGRQQPRDVGPALVVALRPARSLPEPGTHCSHALLGNECVPAEPDLPVEPSEMQAEVQVFRQAVGPWIASERLERCEPGELSVAAEADGAHAIAGRLRKVAEAGELEVLESRD